MSGRSTAHATFTIERLYPASPSRVFQAWANPDAKRRWFACHDDWAASDYALDFRVGGRERATSTPPNAEPHHYDAIYRDIVPDRRIIYSYDMRLGEVRISVSLATVELEPHEGGTRLTLTEQAVFLDGYDDPDARDREEGTRIGLENLAKVLQP